jgi:hypothetical protein
MWVDIDSRHWKISTSRHFQNGHHNTAQIQHCPINSGHWNRTMLNLCAVLWWPFWKWRSVEIFRCQESIRDIIIYLHMKCHFQNGHHNTAQDVPNWFQTLKNVYRLPFSKWPPQYRTNSTLSDFNDRWPFWKWQPVDIFQCLESIRDIIIFPHIKFWWYRTMLNFCGIVVAILKMATSRNCSKKFLPVSIFKMATTTSQKFNIVRYYHNLICG